MPAAAEYYGSEDAWKQLVDRDDLDLVYVVTDWKNHAPMGIYAMEKASTWPLKFRSHDSGRDLGPDQHFRENPQALHDAGKLRVRLL